MKLNYLIKIILIVLFLIPVVNSQNLTLNDYSDLNLSIKLFSNAEINALSDDYEIEYVHSNLSFFPRQDGYLTIMNKKITSNQKFNFLEEEDYIFYNWKNPSLGLLDYSADFKVNSKINFREVRNAIKFPLQKSNSIYLQPTYFINSDDPLIKKQAQEIAKDSDDLYEVVYKLALWTNENINYSLETLTAQVTQNSRWVLDNKRGVCDELTALFIAMLRSLGIEAKFVSGISYTNEINGFGGHAWAEVYFPGEGWIPFDPTYGQYGYVDATHIKMQESVDANTSSVGYSWKYKDVDIDFNNFNFTAEVLSYNNPYKPSINFNINLLENEVGPGSYVPLEIELENLADYYLPATLYIVKGPSLLKDNKIDVLLKPREKKSTFKLIPVTSGLEKGFSYVSIIEITDSYGTSQSAELKYSNEFDAYSLEQAQNKIDKLASSEERNILTDLYFKCYPKKKLYYTYETMIISCDVRNNGNKDLQDINVCFEDNCNKLSLIISQDNIVDFIVPLNHSIDNEIAIKAENPNVLKYAYVKLNVLENPGFKVLDLNIPDELSYNSEYGLNFILKSDAKILDLKIYLGDDLLYKKDSFTKLEEFSIKVKGKNFYNKNKMIITYKDENEVDYKLEKDLNINIINIPWYVRLWNKIF